MRFNNILEDILGNKVKIRLLRYLLSSKLELTGRELSRVTGLHHVVCNNALKQLASLGVVTMHHTGKAILHKINNNSLPVQEILIPLFNVERGLLTNSIKTVLKGLRTEVISAIVFGSVASSLERPTSDVDVLFLVASIAARDKLTSKIEKEEYNFLLKYGNLLSPIVLTLDEFCRRLREKDSLVQNIIRKGKALHGKSIQEVLVECRRRK
jgi:predicted nucleotidyltransferase